MVVVPVRPTGGNIEAFTRTIALVKDHANCPVMIVVNGANRFSATTSFMEWLEKFRTKEAGCHYSDSTIRSVGTGRKL